MIRNLMIILIVTGISFLFFNLYNSFEPSTVLKNSSISKYYADKAVDEVGAQNFVTAIVVTYRGFDTLGEVTILFLAASIIGFFLKTAKSTKQEEKRSVSELFETGSSVIFPLIVIFGAYIFINGHLTPGGGFQGGAVIASGVLLVLLANKTKIISHRFMEVIESFSGFTYVAIGVLGIILASGFLDNRIFALGEFGTLLSAGAIPLIYIFVGLKVGTELSTILINLKNNNIKGN